MVKAHYDIYEEIQSGMPLRLLNYIEANFTQDDLIEDYTNEFHERNDLLPIKEDKRAKPNKEGRIEKMMSYWERGLIVVSEKLQKKRDWIVLKEQHLAFPSGHDDGPDALEGAIAKINEHARIEAPMSMGSYRRNNDY